MSLRLAAIALALRLFEKPHLARERDLGRVRRSFERSAALFRTPPGARFETGRLGGRRAVWARVTPAPAARAILFLHGGAFVMGSPETHRHLAAALALGAGADAALPDYRLAPEHPHPAQVEDALAAYRDLLQAGFAPGRIALAGDSAGGGLAFSLLIALRAAGLADPACLVAFSPWTDMTMRHDSLRRNARRDALLPASRVAEVIGWRLAGADPAEPLASPERARFDRPPPDALIFASRAEIIADDAASMAAALRDGGGAAELVWEARAPHDWPLFIGWAPEADRAVARAAGFIARRLAATDTGDPS